MYKNSETERFLNDCHYNESDGDETTVYLLPQTSVELLNLSKKNVQKKMKWRRIFARYGSRNAVRLFICFLLFPIFFVGHQLSLYSSLHIRQAELSDWQLNEMSRNVSDYVLPENDTTILEPNIMLRPDEKIFILIVVCSSLKNFALRQSIRETWGNQTEFNYAKFAQIHQYMKGEYLPPSEERLKFYSEFLSFKQHAASISTQESIEVPVRVVFMVGRSKPDTLNSTLLEKHLRNEAQQYQDIIQEDFVDTYNNLTIKTVFALKWVMRHCLQNCAFIMKSDDDVFVNVPNLIHYLLGGSIPNYDHTIDSYDYQRLQLQTRSHRHHELRNLLVGHLYCNVAPVANISSKWYMPYDMYPENVYPKYLSGSSYVMSIDVVPLIYKIALKTELVYLEDVFITGLCAEKAVLKRIHQPLFKFQKLVKMCSLKGLITQHEMSADKLIEAYAFTNNLTNICPSIKSTFKHLPLYMLGMNFFKCF